MSDPRNVGAPIGGAADRFLAHYAPREGKHERIPSEAPRGGDPFASNGFLLFMLAGAIALFLLALWAVLG